MFAGKSCLILCHKLLLGEVDGDVENKSVSEAFRYEGKAISGGSWSNYPRVARG